MSNIAKISIVIPVYNEAESLKELYNEIKKVMVENDFSYEIIFVDDGSTDDTFKVVQELFNNDKGIQIIQFRKNFGQTAALGVGFKEATGEFIIPMDADLQNDPADITKMIEKLEEGYDVVSGWRNKREDNFFKKVISSGANVLRKILIKDNITDSGCTLKVYRKECLQDLNLFGEMHRFIPALLMLRGFKITEIKVNHRPRKYGKTKYNFNRTIKGFLDLLLIKFLKDFSARPLYLFGGAGLSSMSLGIVIGLYLSYLKFIENMSIGNRPLLLLGILLIIIGIQLISIGIIGELMISRQEKKKYSIKKILKQ